MKKILALLGAIGLTVGAGATAVACGKRDKGKTVDISNFEKLVDIEVHGKYDTIEQAKEGIQNLKPLPEGIENIQVTIVKENNIKVILTAQKGYKTPKPLIKEFKAKSGETNKQLSEVITKIALGEFATIPSNETLIAKIKELNTTAKDLDLAVDGDVKPEGTIIKTTSSGYIGTVTITFTVKPVDQEVSTDEVQALLDTAVNEKEFADENAAINAAEGIKLPKGLQLDGEPTNSNQIITLKVKAKDGYKIADGQVTSFSATWVQTPIMVEDTTSIGASLTELVNGKEFADETAAITAAKKTQLADGVELDGEPTNSDHTITIKVKAENGYKIADGQETTFTATWVQGKKDIDKEALIKNIEDFLGEGKFASIDEATKAINAAATAGDLIVEGVEVIMAKGDEPEGSKIQITVVNESEYNEVKEFFIDFEIKQSF